jgi:hypothetical protein
MTNDTHAPTADQLQAFTRCLLPAIQRFFDSDEGKREFEKWKAEQSNKAVTD